ncbi:unnamed protein product [Mortierella alpina]
MADHAADSSQAMSTTSGPGSGTTKASGLVSADSAQPSSPMEVLAAEELELATPIVLSSHHSSPIFLKGAKNNIMLGATPSPHPLSMNTESNSLHHFQANMNHGNMYTHSTPNSAYIHAALGPLAHSSPVPGYSSATIPSSTTAAFMAMHGHNTSLYDSPRRNSVPTLTAGQAEHKRKKSEEKTLHRQSSWSNLSSASSMMGGFPSAPLPGVHHPQASNHVDPAMMNYYRTQVSQQSLNQVMPSSAHSSACPSPMPETFLPGSMLSNMTSSPLASLCSSENQVGNKAKRNNSICSTTSMSSTGSASSSSNNNKHPCRFSNCGWTFKRYEHLKRHMLVHSKERPFVCDYHGCNKTFSRSDNYSAHLRTHSNKKGSISSSPSEHHHHRHDSHAAGREDDDSESLVKQESLEQFHETSEYGQNYSPTQSAENAPSSMSDDEPFGMMSESGYSFGSNAIYPIDPIDHLSGMVPRFDTIRLDLKSVAPSDIHKHSYGEDSNTETLLSGAANPNGESPHPSPMPHYEHFTFPSSISTHFMPMLNGGFPIDHSSLHQHHHHALQHQPSQESISSSPYSSLPSSADSSTTSISTFHSTPSYHPNEHDLRGFPFTSGAVHGSIDSNDIHYPSAAPQMSEDGSIMHHHPLHPSSFHHHGSHTDLQMLHHPSFPAMHHSTSTSALPPHPLMSTTSPFTATPGLNEPLYTAPSSSSSSVSSSLAGSRATVNNDAITGSAITANSSSGASSGNSNGSTGSKHGGSGKHHTCSVSGCSKRFKRLEHLKRHIKTHTLERPFNCPYATCTKKFSRSDNLSQHVKTHLRQLNKQQNKQRNQAQAQAQHAL